MPVWSRVEVNLFLLWLAAAAPTLGQDCPGGDQARQAGEIALSQNKYGEAEKHFIAALTAAEKSGSTLRVAEICKSLAVLHQVRGNGTRAEAYLERELRCREKALGGEHPKVVACVGRLVLFYLSSGNVQKAERLGGLLQRYADRLLKQGDQVQEQLVFLQKFYSSHPEYSEVGSRLKQLREANDKVRADDHLELAASLDAIAAVYKEKNKLPAAEHLYRKALTLREKALPPGHLALAFSYENVANLLTAQGRSGEAQELYRRALDVTGKKLDLKRPEVYSRLESLARSYLGSGQDREAESLYKQAITLMTQSGRALHKDLGAASQALGALYIRNGRAADAEPLLKTALNIAEANNGPESAALVPILESYALALEKNQRQSEASRMRSRAGKIKGVTACISDAQGF